MMMVRMPVELLPLLAGRPLLSRRRCAVVLREGGDRRRQHEAGEIYTKKCANHASLRPHHASPYTAQPTSRVLGGAVGQHPCDVRRVGSAGFASVTAMPISTVRRE